MLRSSGILILAAAAVWAQTADDKLAAVSGTVLDAATGAPIVRAHVTCDGYLAGKMQQFGALTNAEGKFSISALPPGSYQLGAERIGYVAPIEGGTAGLRTTLREGETKSDVKLKLEQTGAILGRVLDGDGNPLEGVRVIAETGARANSISVPAGATTDEKGQYRLGGLGAGKYRVRAMPAPLPSPPEVRTDGSEESHSVATYHPDSLTASGATRVEVRSAIDLTGIDIRLQRIPKTRVSGMVTGIPEGVRPQTAGISFLSNGVAADGSFRVWNVMPGKYAVTARVSMQGRQIQSAPVEIEIARDHVDGLELRLVPQFELMGKIEFESDSARPKPPANGGPTPRFNLQMAAQIGPQTGGMPMTVTEDASFRFANLQPGKYRFVYGWRASVRSIRLGTVEIEGNLIDLTNGAGGAPLTVVLGPAEAEITGIVTDEKGPVAGAPVGLVNTGISLTTSNATFGTVTGADGRFRLANVPAGKYVLFSPDENDRAVWAGNYEDYADVLAEVEVGIKGTIEKDLRRRPKK
jgi:protocatechuate 3,4-dioxygenase beta subunit